MDDLLGEFLAETTESLETVDTRLVAFESDPTDADALNCVFRLIHTIKGTCGFLGLPVLESVAHAGETLLGRLRDGSLEPDSDAVCLVLECVDHIRSLLSHLETDGTEPENGPAQAQNLIERLQRASGPSQDPIPDQFEVTTTASGDFDISVPLQGADDEGDDEKEPSGATVADVSGTPASGASPPGDPSVAGVRAGQTIRVRLDVLEDLMTMVSELVLTRNQLLQIARTEEDSVFSTPLQKLSSVTAELQETVMKTRMQPIGSAWKKLPRIVRDAAHELGKKIALVTEGESTELDRQVLDLIADPLTHMVRNACDHGIEDPRTRSALGKPITGTVRIHAYHEGGHILIELRDDGAGLDPPRIRERAVARGVITADANMSDSQLMRLIFEPGFSTAQTVTHLSGRGVGMDVVRTNIELIGGTVELASTPGVGSVFTIKIPLTLAIIPALIIGVCGQKTALPQRAIVELVKLGREYEVELIDDAPVLRLRERLLPLVFLSDLLQLSSEAEVSGSGFVVVMDIGGASFGLVVDDVFDPEEIVVKPLSRLLGTRAEYSGATILGDGAVSLILDPVGLARAVRGAETSDQKQEVVPGSQESEHPQTSLLVFRAGDGVFRACFLNLVSRLEILDAAEFGSSSCGQSVQYRGSLMPLVSLHPEGEIASSGRVPVIVFGQTSQQVGVVVTEICDIVEEVVSVEIGSQSDGLIGTAIIRGQTTQIIDVAYYLNRARPDWADRGESVTSGRIRDVLLIESHPFFRNLLDPLLTAAGYRVTMAGSQTQARRLIDEGGIFAAVLADVDGLPEASELDVFGVTCPAVIRLSSRQLDQAAVAKTDRRAVLSALEEAIRAA